jgi:hypothetical protein
MESDGDETERDYKLSAILIHLLVQNPYVLTLLRHFVST